MKLTTESLAKAAKTLEEHLGKCLEVHKSHEEHMHKAHDSIEKKHAELGEHIEKCMKAAKEVSEGEEPTEKVAPAGAIAEPTAAEKALTEKLEGLSKAFDALTAKLAKTAAPGGPASGVAITERESVEVTGGLFKSAKPIEL